LQSANIDAVQHVYDLARRGKRDEVRALLRDDATWHPAREGAWKPCTNADDVLRTILWRAGVNRMRPSDFIDLGDRVVLQVRGRAVQRLGAKGLLFPKLFQIVALRDGKVASIQDYPTRAAAYAAAGLNT
jgi:ketosteroid isomerase-like protein